MRCCGASSPVHKLSNIRTEVPIITKRKKEALCLSTSFRGFIYYLWTQCCPLSPTAAEAQTGSRVCPFELFKNGELWYFHRALSTRTQPCASVNLITPEPIEEAGGVGEQTELKRGGNGQMEGADQMQRHIITGRKWNGFKWGWEEWAASGWRGMMRIQGYKLRFGGFAVEQLDQTFWLK